LLNGKYLNVVELYDVFLDRGVHYLARGQGGALPNTDTPTVISFA
jgi:hypothetical protein